MAANAATHFLLFDIICQNQIEAAFISTRKEKRSLPPLDKILQDVYESQSLENVGVGVFHCAWLSIRISTPCAEAHASA